MHQIYKELAQRFAEVGIAAIVMDYYGRTAGLTSRDEPFDFWPHVSQLRGPSIFADATAVRAYLQASTGDERPPSLLAFAWAGASRCTPGEKASD